MANFAVYTVEAFERCEKFENIAMVLKLDTRRQCSRRAHPADGIAPHTATVKSDAKSDVGDTEMAKKTSNETPIGFIVKKREHRRWLTFLLETGNSK